MSKAFEWVGVTDGRARFCGMIRGWDERGHETFAIEIDGRPVYGEVDAVFDGHAISMNVVSFGYLEQSRVGVTGAARSCTLEQAAIAERDIRELISAVSAYADELDKPEVLRTTPSTHFTGNVAFAPGWIIIDDAPTPRAQ
jgi:hypothetical protein